MTTISQPRVAVVTGAARGIGKSIALRLADDGLDVAVNDLHDQKELLEGVVEDIQKKGRQAVAVCGDVSEEQDVKALIDKAVEKLGGVDVMVANAGIGSFESILDSTVENWDRIMRINTRGPMLAYKYAAKQMVKQGRGGRIIGASSICGKKGAVNLAAYSASKFAVRGLTQSAARELAEHGITVNAYAPGVIRTQMTASAADGDKGHGSALLNILGAPNARSAEPDVVSSLVSYLVKPEAHFITGQTITTDGGMVFD